MYCLFFLNICLFVCVRGENWRRRTELSYIPRAGPRVSQKKGINVSKHPSSMSSRQREMEIQNQAGSFVVYQKKGMNE